MRSGRGAPVGTPMDAYDYGLPESAIAQDPLEPRSAARLLVGPGLGGERGRPPMPPWPTCPACCDPGDVAGGQRHPGAARPGWPCVKAAGGQAEVLLLEPVAARSRAMPGDVWEALVRPGRRLPAPHPAVRARGRTRCATGGRGGRRSWAVPTTAGAWSACSTPRVVERSGSMPLPPYIHQPLDDPERYQTVYSRPPGARRPFHRRPHRRAPLHPGAPRRLCWPPGRPLARVDLAIGLDTFRPVTAATAEEHVIHTERYSVPAGDHGRLRRRRAGGGGGHHRRSGPSSRRRPPGDLSGRTDLYIHGDYPLPDGRRPGHQLPPAPVQPPAPGRGVLRTGVAASSTPPPSAEGYRFLSFGDAMVVGRTGRGPCGSMGRGTRPVNP